MTTLVCSLIVVRLGRNSVLPASPHTNIALTPSLPFKIIRLLFLRYSLPTALCTTFPTLTTLSTALYTAFSLGKLNARDQ